MKKRILSWALVLCMVLALLPGAALATGETGAASDTPYAVEGGNLYFDADGVIVSCDRTVTGATIPAEIESVQVKAVGALAFAGCDALTELRFMGDMPEFADNAFYGISATVYYPRANTTWKATNLENDAFGAKSLA